MAPTKHALPALQGAKRRQPESQILVFGFKETTADDREHPALVIPR